MDIDCIAKVADILGKFGQFIFGLLALALSIVAILAKKRDIFKTELAKAQFCEIGNIRDVLSEIFFDIHYVAGYKATMETMEWSLEDFKKLCPEEWEQFSRYKQNSFKIFYAFMTPDFYLIPDWVDKETIKKHHEMMMKFAPFSIVSTGTIDASQIEQYQLKIQELIKYLDVSLKKNS